MRDLNILLVIACDVLRQSLKRHIAHVASHLSRSLARYAILTTNYLSVRRHHKLYSVNARIFKCFI